MNPPTCPQCGGPSREDLPYCIYCRSLFPSYSPSIKNKFRRVACYSDYSPSMEYSKSLSPSVSPTLSASPSFSPSPSPAPYEIAYSGAPIYRPAYKNVEVYSTPVHKSIWKRILKVSER